MGFNSKNGPALAYTLPFLRQDTKIKPLAMISQTQTQKQQLKILPQQIQLLNLYFLNTLEMEQRMKNEIEENPFLDQNAEEPETAESKKDKEEIKDFQDYDEFMYDDRPDYRQEYGNYFAEETVPLMAISAPPTFKEEAKSQLRMMDLPEADLLLGEYLIELLNERGILDKSLEEVSDDLSFHLHQIVEEKEIERILKLVQTLEPVGLGARSIQECLEMQLSKLDNRLSVNRAAKKLIRHHYNDLMHRQFEKITHALSIDEDELRDVLNVIATLHFYPVTESGASLEAKSTIIPDFIITRQGDGIQVSLYNSRAKSIFVNQSLYEQLSGQCTARDRSALQYVRSKLQSAQWFVNAVKQREDTMMRIMQAIVMFQQEYFMEGDIRKLRPMVLRMVAEKSGLDISTVSRITSNKYADTHFGLVYLKDLFSEGIADKQGVVISNKVIQNVIQEAISAEDKRKPYTDQQLVNILSTKGYNIARRTVAKYREQMRIPIAQIRAVWA